MRPGTVDILLAEDEDTDVFFLQQAFMQSKAKNRLHVVRDGVEVLDFLHRRNGFENAVRPNLILMDINMPRRCGHETLRMLKQDSDFCDIPIIMLSGSQATEDIRKSYQNHANAYVPKSQGFTEILDFVNAVEKFWFENAELPGD